MPLVFYAGFRGGILDSEGKQGSVIMMPNGSNPSDDFSWC